MRDPYSILGVAKDANQNEIKAAWRATAKALHPDQNPNDPKAANRFTEAGRAYDLLKDPDKRRLFDEARARAAGRGGKQQTFMEQRAERARAEAEAKARAQAEARAAAAAASVAAARSAQADNAGTESAEEVVSKIFGTRKPNEKAETNGSQASKSQQQSEAPRQPDPTAAAAPANADGADQERQPGDLTPDQRGSPALELMSYLLKRLTRQVPAPEKAPDLTVDVSVTIEDILNRINPAITLPDGKLLSITLPESMTDGAEVRVEGYGHRLQGMKRGDVVARLRIKPHRWYRVDGHDIRTSVDIDIDKAVLGGDVKVETPDGATAITIPSWSGSQYTARISGRGLPKGAGQRGDLIAEVRVMLWDRPDQKLVDLMRSLRDGLYL